MNKDDKAFPSLDQDPRYSKQKILAMIQSGLDTRDYIAIKAMQGILANPESTQYTERDVARMAYNMVDAMIEESNSDIKKD